MKSSEYLKELRTQSAAQLQEQLVAAKKELFNLRFQNATNQLDNTGRIKEVRKNEKLTQQEFADRLNLKRNTVGSYEVNVVEPSDRTIKDICDKFGVREAWLRTGEGEMFVQDTQSEQVAAFLADLTKDDSDTFKKRFVEMLAGLSPADWELLERMAEKLTQKKEESP